MTGSSSEVLNGGLLEDREVANLHCFGTGEYGEILDFQKDVRRRRGLGEIVDTWLLGQHPTVITQGVRAKRDDIAQPSSLAYPTPPSDAQSAPAVFEIDRGGLTTLHSPGQMILYPITRVRGGSLAAGRFARTLLEAMQRWIAGEFGVQTSPRPRQPGLFVEGRKLLSIGISARGGITMHGIALNLCNDLSLWDSIIPCGDPAIRPVSLSEILDRPVEVEDQTESISRWLSETWGYQRITLVDRGLAADPATVSNEVRT